MFRNLLQETSKPLIEARFGMKNENVQDSNARIEWTWEKPGESDFVNVMNDNKDVKFHKNFSSGTAVVRGTLPMSHGQYFWELKMISPVYGTDMMIGIGTPEADVSQVHDKFISLLGNDKQTWGLSYTGLFHHNGDARAYSGRFGQGSIIGVHLDCWHGTLSFYKNKKHLGIASRGLTGKTLYAMASSTAACSGMRIIRSCSFPSSLQYLCCAKLRELIPDDKHVLRAIELPPGLRLFLNNNLGWLMDSRFAEYTAPCIPRRTGWSFALKPDSSDPIMTNTLVGVDESEDESILEQPPSDGESVVMIGNRPFILQCGRQRRRTRGGVIRIRTSDGGSREESDRESSFLAPLEMDRTFEMIDIEDEAEFNEAKRRRLSYNYAMGLSDVDSD